MSDKHIKRLTDKYHEAVSKYNANRSSPYLYFAMKKAEKNLNEQLKNELKKSKP